MSPVGNEFRRVPGRRIDGRSGQNSIPMDSNTARPSYVTQFKPAHYRNVTAATHLSNEANSQQPTDTRHECAELPTVCNAERR